MDIKDILESTKHLSGNDKAKLAHCLISSLDTAQDDNVDGAWAELAEERLSQLNSGAVKGVSWSEIKEQVIGK